MEKRKHASEDCLLWAENFSQALCSNSPPLTSVFDDCFSRNISNLPYTFIIRIYWRFYGSFIWFG